MFPLAECGPITITVTPCDFPLSWTLTLRPHRCREEGTPPPPQGGGGKKIRAIVSSVGGRGAFHHRHRHNTITNVSYNSTKLLRRDERNESSSFRIWQQAASRPNDTTAPAGRRSVGDAEREEIVEEGQTQAAVVEEQYEGHEPRQFVRREAPAGLYVLQVRQGVALFPTAAVLIITQNNVAQ